MTVRSLLFVPADRADRLAKGHLRGADAVIADLEDAVAPADKDAALANVVAWLSSAPRDTESWVRLNSGEQGLDELHVLSKYEQLTGVLAPKVESSDEVASLHAIGTSRVKIAPMIESAVGLVNAVQIASAPGVFQLHIGELDLGADLRFGADSGHDEFAFARSTVVVASRYAGLLPPVGPVSPNFSELAEFDRGTRLLARMGFVGRDCIHPDQVTVANAVFAVDESELEAARDVLARAAQEGGSFRGRDGAMVDEAVLRHARQLLGQAGESDGQPSEAERSRP
jgi:citrate lyase subunit beta/citryl-CoA lyase